MEEEEEVLEEVLVEVLVEVLEDVEDIQEIQKYQYQSSLHLLPLLDWIMVTCLYYNQTNEILGHLAEHESKVLPLRVELRSGWAWFVV